MDCITCGRVFMPETGKPGLKDECWQCGEIREGEMGIKRKLEPVFVPSFAAYGPTRGGWLQNKKRKGKGK